MMNNVKPIDKAYFRTQAFPLQHLKLHKLYHYHLEL